MPTHTADFVILRRRLSEINAPCSARFTPPLSWTLNPVKSPIYKRFAGPVPIRVLKDAPRQFHPPTARKTRVSRGPSPPIQINMDMYSGRWQIPSLTIKSFV